MQIPWLNTIFSFTAVAIALLGTRQARASSQFGKVSPPPPKFVLPLSLNEYSVLNVSEMDGLLKYGGSGTFQVEMARAGSNVIWNITVDNARLMELLGIFVGDRTVKLVQNLDVNNLDPNQKIALDTIKSLTQKLDYARKNPIWDSIRIAGTVAESGTNWILQTTNESVKIVGVALDKLSGYVGRSVLADGFLKVAGEFEVTRMLEKKENTLEIFVMSHCPFGQRAESKLLTFLNQTNADCKPKLEIHYVFYKQQNNGLQTFTSMHGKEEVIENLVQMAIRDNYPKHFPDYVRLRFANPSASWMNLVEQLSLTSSEEGEIGRLITMERDQMIRAEYDYALQRYGITDGSPSYVWESERVSDLTRIPAFRGLEAIAAESCSH